MKSRISPLAAALVVFGFFIVRAAIDVIGRTGWPPVIVLDHVVRGLAIASVFAGIAAGAIALLNWFAKGRD